VNVGGLEMGLAVAVYIAVVLVLGLRARRGASNTPDEYFLAGRGLGPVVLFMALFGTNATSFVLVGIPAAAYEHGIGVFGLNAPIIALGIPLTFWAVGSPARRMARRLGALTPAELYAARFGSPAVGFVLFAVFTAYTVPYMVQAVKSAALILHGVSGGLLSTSLVGLAVVAVALLYTSLGGMRATAWTNVFQGSLFLVFMVAAFFLVADSLGGPSAATGAVAAVKPERLELGTDWLFEPRAWTSWSLVISLTVIGFPHMFVRLLAAADERAIATVSRAYPIALVLLWTPAVLLGVWGVAAFPDLENPDRIFQLMTGTHLPAALGSLGFLAVLAAVMSTLDAQILTLSSMVVRDVAAPLGWSSERRQVWLGRWFAGAIGALIWTLAELWDDSIFGISRKAFEGYTTLFPALLLGVRWRRLTATGLVSSVVAGNAVLALGWMEVLPTGGFLPVFWALLVGFAVAFAVSLLGSAPRADRTSRAFGDAREVQGRTYSA